MNKSLKALEIHPMFHREIEGGGAGVSIREGKRNFNAEEGVMLCCGLTSWCVPAKIISATYANVMTVSSEHLEQYGVNDTKELLQALRIHYPTIQLSTNVTIIEFIPILPDKEKKLAAILKWKCKR